MDVQLPKVQIDLTNRPTQYIVVGLFLALVLGVSSWWFLPTWLHDHQAEKHVEKQIEMKEQTEQLKTQAAQADAQGEVHATEAKKSEDALQKTTKTITEKKKYAEKLDKKIADAGRRDVPDSDVPSNDDLCARANTLGIRCDSGH